MSIDVKEDYHTLYRVAIFKSFNEYKPQTIRIRCSLYVLLNHREEN